jgi:Predicted transcriptional regulators
MTIGERIRDARKAAGLTQQELAEKVGIRNTSVSKWESGAVKQIPTERLMVLAEALGKTPSELLGWDDAKERMAVTGVTMDELAAEMNLAAADIRHILSGGGGGVGPSRRSPARSPTSRRRSSA